MSQHDTEELYASRLKVSEIEFNHAMKELVESIEDREPEECPYPGCGAMLPRDIEFQQLHMFRCHPVGMEGRE